MQTEVIKEKHGWQLKVADKLLTTPRKTPLFFPHEALAEAAAEEWRAAKKFSPSSMPLTSIAFTAVDVVAEQGQRMIEAMLAFADTDLLLYRSETKELLARQERAWNPIIAWIRTRYDCAPNVTEGVMPVVQPEKMMATFRSTMEGFDPFTLAAFSVVTQSLGSLLLALAVKEKHLTAEEAFRLSRIDEDYQAEIWGEDSVALGRAREIKRDVLAATKFLGLLGG